MTTTTNTTPNFADKTVWTGDNLDILRGLNSACVDLVVNNLQLLGAHCNQVKGDRPQEDLPPGLREMSIAA